MASLDMSVEYVLRQEDATLSGKVIALAGDSGGRTRYGLAEKWHPEMTATGYFDGMPNYSALALAKTVYAAEYGTALHVSEMESQAVADKLLSFAINMGPGQAVKLMQSALCQAGQTVACDGKLGEATLAAINQSDAGVLLTHLRAVAGAFYQAIVAKNPSQQRFLTGWLNRANA